MTFDLTDLKLRLRNSELRPVYTAAEGLQRIAGPLQRVRDFETVSGRDNLAQAVIMRLLTPLGELAALGHPDYGSRLHELIGQPNNDTLRNLAKVYILDTLSRERRIAKVVAVNVTASPGTRDQIDILLVVLPAGEMQPLTVGPLTLDIGL